MDLIIGTAGHIDHGKTSLVRALTGVDTDRLPEEKERGITVDLGFAELQIGDVRAGFVDVPGHERFIKNMLAGAAGIDLVLLVVAADEGVMPQTREHFDIVRLLGIRDGIVALTKADLVDDDTLELARLDVAELAEGTFLEDAPVISVSSVTGSGLKELTEAIAARSANLTRGSDGLAARLPIDRSFSVKGFGTVVTGTLASGTIAEGDELELLPERRTLRVRGVQVHGRKVAAAVAPCRVAVNLAGIEAAELTRGMTLAGPGALIPTQVVDASIETLPGLPRTIRNRQRVRVHIGTAEALARIQVIEPVGEIGPDSSGLVQLRFERAVATLPGERFVIRTYSPARTVAGGQILAVEAPKHRQRDLADRREFLNRLQAAERSAESIFLMIEAEGERGVSISSIRRRMGLSSSAVDAALAELVRRNAVELIGETAVDSTALERLCRSVVEQVSRFHAVETIARGIRRVDLRQQVSAKASDTAFEGALNRLVSAGELVAERDLVMLAGHGGEMSPAESAVRDRLIASFERAGLEPDKIDVIMAASVQDSKLSPAEVQKLLQRLLNDKKVVKVTEEYWFSASSVDALRHNLRRFADQTADRTIDMAQSKEISGLSRKYAIPLIEYLDRERFTVRRGDKRVIL